MLSVLKCRIHTLVKFLRLKQTNFAIIEASTWHVLEGNKHDIFSNLSKRDSTNSNLSVCHRTLNVSCRPIALLEKFCLDQRIKFKHCKSTYTMEENKDRSRNKEKYKYPPSDSISIEDGVDISDLQIDDVQYVEEPLTLDKLPLELLMYICNFLDAKFLVHTLSKVCRSFQDLFDSDIYWKTRISKRWPKPYPPVYEENFSWMDACVAREESHRVWSKPNETCNHFFFREAIFAPVDAVHLMNNGTILASGSRDRYLNILDLTKYNPEDPASIKSMKIYSDAKAHKGWIWSLSSHDDTLCSGSWDTYIKTWDLNNGVAERAKYKCKSAILGIHFEANQIFAAGYDRHVYVIDPRDKEVHRKRYHRRPVLCLAADDKYVVTGSEDKTIAVFDRRAGQVYKTIQLESYAMDISFGHQQLWVADKDGNLQLFDASLGQFEHVQTYDVGHTGKATGVIYTPGAIFSCSMDNTIKVLEPSRNPDAITTLTHHTAAVTRLSYQNGVLASAGSDVSVGVWMPK